MRTLLTGFAACAATFSTGLPCRTTSAVPDNGAVAEAWPVTGITIDGSLEDWPELPRFSIERDYFTDDKPAVEDYSASFRAGYNATEGCVYVAVEVRDQFHYLDPENESEWFDLDAHLLYLDPTHAPRGSGSRLYAAYGEHRSLEGIDATWDPAVAATTWDGCDVAVGRNGDTTTYEWRILVGDQVQPGRTLGIDHMLVDKDDDDGEGISTLTIWGGYGSKSRGASRCGDLILVDPTKEAGSVKGKVRWKTESEDWLPRRIRIVSKEDPAFWIHIKADDEDGIYEVDLPAGHYTVSCPFKSTGEDPSDYRRLDPSVQVEVEIAAGSQTLASDLELEVLEAPVFPADKGLLMDYDPSQSAEVDRFVQESMDYFQVPGVSLALIADGRLVYHQMYGVKNHFTQEPVSEETLFEAASITKIVFAFLVNQMAERGMIDLDRPLHEYLPFVEIADDPRYRLITARHCLSHQTGFPNWRRYNADGLMSIDFYPGTQFGYSGEGFEYLGRVVTHLYNEAQPVHGDGAPRPLTLDEILRKEVAVPFGFDRNTYFSASPALRERAAHGHFTKRVAACYLPEALGVAHSMHTEAKSFAGFLTGLLARQGLTAETYKQMFTPQIGYDLDEDYVGPRWPRYYGLGFHLMDTPFGWAFGHGGSNGDFKCRAEAYIDPQVGFVVFTNGDSGELLYGRLRDFLIGR